MKTIGCYYVYIVTNKNKTVLYTGISNDLLRRLAEHKEDSLNFNAKSFCGRYNVYFLLYYELLEYAKDAIAREKEIKGWSRAKKELLINSFNPDWRFLNDEL